MKHCFLCNTIYVINRRKNLCKIFLKNKKVGKSLLQYSLSNQKCINIIFQISFTKHNLNTLRLSTE